MQNLSTQTGVVIAYTFDPRQAEWRLAAVDKDGKEHYAIRPNHAAWFASIRQEELTFPNLAPDQVKSLRFETRPREWVQFEGMVTNPNAPAASNNTQNPAAIAERQALIRTLQAQRAAELAYAKAHNAAPDSSKTDSTPAQPGNYYLMGGSRPGVYPLGTQPLTVLQAVVSSGVTQSDLSALRIVVVRQKNGKSEMPVNTTLDKLLHEDAVQIQSGDIVWIKDISDLRQQEAKLKDTISDLQHDIDQSSRSPDNIVRKRVQEQMTRAQQKLEELSNQENQQ
jgi:hypothetical protein